MNTAKPDHLTPPLQFALRLLKDRVEAALKSLEEKERQVPQMEVDSKKDDDADDDANSKAKQDSKGDPKSGEKRKEMEGRVEDRKEEEDESEDTSKPSSSKKARTCSASAPTPGGSGTGAAASDSKKRTEESSRLAEAYEVCLKTLGLLVQMCENKVKVQETAAALVSAQQVNCEDVFCTY